MSSTNRREVNSNQLKQETKANVTAKVRGDAIGKSYRRWKLQLNADSTFSTHVIHVQVGAAGTNGSQGPCFEIAQLLCGDKYWASSCCVTELFCR